MCIRDSNRTLTNPAGIRIIDSTYLVLLGNRCFDDQATKTQDYGIKEIGTSDYNIISHNILVGNKTGAISTVGVNTQALDNIT